MELANYFQYNSVLILTFFFTSFAVLILKYITLGKSNEILFSSYRSSLLNPLTYIRLFTHILGHRDWQHFSNNYLKILILGPLIEEKYGSINLLIMILLTALITGIVNAIIGNARIKGASNITFMLIVLSAFVNITDNQIPFTLVLVIIFYVLDEIRDLKKDDNIAHFGHLTGAVCGIVFGFIYKNTKIFKFINDWIINLVWVWKVD